jgi:hypothetical protein
MPDLGPRASAPACCLCQSQHLGSRGPHTWLHRQRSLSTTAGFCLRLSSRDLLCPSPFHNNTDGIASHGLEKGFRSAYSLGVMIIRTHSPPQKKKGYFLTSCGGWAVHREEGWEWPHQWPPPTLAWVVGVLRSYKSTCRDVDDHSSLESKSSRRVGIRYPHGEV